MNDIVYLSVKIFQLYRAPFTVSSSSNHKFDFPGPAVRVLFYICGSVFEALPRTKLDDNEMEKAFTFFYLAVLCSHFLE
jgi:hypothetical protein